MYFPIFQLIMAEGEVFIINVFFFNFRCYFIHVRNISKRTDMIQIQQNTPTSFICSLKKKIDLLKQKIVENAKATFCFNISSFIFHGYCSRLLAFISSICFFFFFWLMHYFFFFFLYKSLLFSVLFPCGYGFLVCFPLYTCFPTLPHSLHAFPLQPFLSRLTAPALSLEQPKTNKTKTSLAWGLRGLLAERCFGKCAFLFLIYITALKKIQ